MSDLLPQTARIQIEARLAPGEDADSHIIFIEGEIALEALKGAVRQTLAYMSKDGILEAVEDEIDQYSN